MSTNLKPPVNAADHVEGNPHAPIELVEYGDYECPHCGHAYPIIKNIQKRMGAKLKFVFRNFPLTEIHPEAFNAALATEAAALQNKFWEMHDLLYQNQQQWSSASDPSPIFNQYATQLGLNAAQFKSDYGSSKVNDLINADMAEGTKLGIQGTPTFFIDGKKVEVTNSISSFEKVLKAAIAKKAAASTSTKSQ